MEPCRAAHKAIGREDNCCTGSAELERHLPAALHSYCNSFLLHLVHLVVLRGLRDTWKKMAVHEFYSLLNCADCRCWRDDLLTYGRSSERQ